MKVTKTDIEALARDKALRRLSERLADCKDETQAVEAALGHIKDIAETRNLAARRKIARRLRKVAEWIEEL